MTEKHQKYRGVVVAGVGNMSKRMSAGSIALKVYEDAAGCNLVPGSLNIELAREFDMPTTSKKLTRNDREGVATILFIPVLINDVVAFAVRNQIAEDGHGRHSKRVIEIISPHNLRATLHLKDGDTVTIVF